MMIKSAARHIDEGVNLDYNKLSKKIKIMISINHDQTTTPNTTA